MKYKLGKKPFVPDARDLKLKDFLKITEIPKYPTKFGHEKLVPEWYMLGNDKRGCCVPTSAAHETMLINKANGRDVLFTEDCVTKDYSDVTGYVLGDDSTDNGTEMRAYMSYRRKVGILDGLGNRHKILAYLSVDPKDLHALYTAMYLFGTVSIGFEVPDYAIDQFDQGKPWSIISGKKYNTVGGHCVCPVAKRTRIQTITWAKEQGMTGTFYKTFNDETWVYFTDEYFTNNLSPEHFDKQKLLDVLNALPKA
jgi:hypothetical protein